MNQDIKFRYRLKNKSGDLKTVVFTLQAIEGGALLPYFGNYWKVEKREAFTGIKDRNKKEVFEGDVLKVNSFQVAIPNEIAEVTLQDGCFAVKTSTMYGLDGMKCLRDLGDIEVIGSAQDNPELL